MNIKNIILKAWRVVIKSERIIFLDEKIKLEAPRHDSSIKEVKNWGRTLYFFYFYFYYFYFYSWYFSLQSVSRLNKFTNASLILNNSFEWFFISYSSYLIPQSQISFALIYSWQNFNRDREINPSLNFFSDCTQASNF